MDISTLPTNVHNGPPWIYRDFHKGAKLRTIERYWRQHTICPDILNSISCNDAAAANSCPTQRSGKQITLLLPDALTWRKYLRLIRKVVEETCIEDTPVDDDHDDLYWIMTESVAEELDHRNQSLPEASAPQERSILQRLIQTNEKILPFVDLSIRNMQSCKEDEFETLHYTRLTLHERSRHALVRAGSLLRQTYNDKDCDAELVCCWLVVDKEAAQFCLDDEDRIRYISMDNILALLAKKEHWSAHRVQQLDQLMIQCEQEYQRRNAPPPEKSPDIIFTALSQDEIRRRMRMGQLMRGRLQISRENVREAYVTTSSGKHTYFIQHDDFNHAFHDDIVLIEPLPEAEWGYPVGKRRLVHQTNSGDDDYADEINIDDRETIAPANASPVPTARVRIVDQPTRRVFVATLTDVPNIGDGAVLVVPMDLRVPKIRIKTRAWQRFLGVRLQVKILDWEEDSTYPLGHCVKILGPIGDLETEIEALMIENQIELDPFSAAALACLPVEGSNWKVTDEDINARYDLRKARRVFSVDPPGCQDIDDTMHAETLPNGDIEGKSFQHQDLIRISS